MVVTLLVFGVLGNKLNSGYEFTKARLRLNTKPKTIFQVKNKKKKSLVFLKSVQIHCEGIYPVEILEEHKKLFNRV